jgi:hypothetical protein
MTTQKNELLTAYQIASESEATLNKSDVSILSGQNSVGGGFDEAPPPLPSYSRRSLDAFGISTPTTTVAATGNTNIDGLLSGVKWSSTSVSFSFPDSINDYEANYYDRAYHGATFQALNAAQQDAARAWLFTGGAFSNVSLLAPFESTNDLDATIRMAMSDVPWTAFAYYPNSSFVEGGDSWFNRTDYNNPILGTYAYHTFGHELGHALGLKHGHEADGPANVSMNADRDSMEFSIMTYRSYVGHDITALPYYTNEDGGYAQSLMMYDIAAIQHTHGPSFGYNSGNANYTFSTTAGEMFINGVGQGQPVANRVFRTVWDGDGIDTYDFSGYTTIYQIASESEATLNKSDVNILSGQNSVGGGFDEAPPPLPSYSRRSLDAFGISTPTTTVAATGNTNIDGLLSGVKWSSTSVSFSFPDSINDYEANYYDRAYHGATFQALNAAQQDAARAWLFTGGAFSNVSLLAPFESTNDLDATIRMAMSDVPWTAFAYYPNSSFVEGGDSWFNRTDYNNPILGTYAYHTFGHELGHALGLKHGHEADGPANVSMNADRDSMEFSIMTYRSYVGHDITALPYYTNEDGGYAQSLMMYDIAAIQHMYGPSFGYNSGNTNYTFSATTGEMFINGVGQGLPVANRVFRTVWDGDGIDTYDFSSYTTNLSIDLTPGGWSDLSVGGTFQKAALNPGYGGITLYARGHVFNALQYNGDARSLIENANGGSGNDVFIGNQANNILNGGSGNDTLAGGIGKDTIVGGSGLDTLTYDSLSESLLAGFDVIQGYSGTGLSKDSIKAPSSIAANILTSSTGTATALTQAAIQSVLTSATFAINTAKAFQVTGQTGTFIALNDGVAGFQSATDAIIQLADYNINAATPVEIINVVCFLAGTLIQTPHGERPIESLQPGDLICSTDGPQPVKFLSRTRRHRKALLALGKLPVRINQGALGELGPCRDTFMSPSHAINLDRHLVEAGALLNGSSIKQLVNWSRGDFLTYYNIELEAHSLIWANGMPVETYFANVRGISFTREDWDNYSDYIALYGSSELMQELSLPRIPFARQIPTFLREKFQLISLPLLCLDPSAAAV